MITTVLTITVLALALTPAIIFLINQRLYRPPPAAPPLRRLACSTASSSAASQANDEEDDEACDEREYENARALREARLQPPQISLLIPARNEAAAIYDCVASALASTGVDLEVVVLDDHSEDQTAEIVRGIASRDPRVRVLPTPELPAGWCGKQHACWQLSRLASYDIFVFIDADVRLEPQGLARSAAFLIQSEANLVSGIPRQVTRSPAECLLLPLIHFILLGFLPIWRMRSSRAAAYGAGCGQLFATTRQAYSRAGGHRAIRHSLHDGVTLPRAYRRAGLITDLFDATDVASCRMYHSTGEVWRGLAKNATEGLASPAAIGAWTLILLGGQVLPWLLLLTGLSIAYGTGGPTHPQWLADLASPTSLVAMGLACFSGALVRFAAARRYNQPALAALMHPLGVAALMLIQWVALVRLILRRPASWRGRAYVGR